MTVLGTIPLLLTKTPSEEVRGGMIRHCLGRAESSVAHLDFTDGFACAH